LYSARMAMFMNDVGIKTARIISRGRLSDRWILASSYQPIDESEYGTTFALVAVLHPWFPSPQLATVVTNTFNREYFKAAKSTSPLSAFEVAIKKVNETLSERAEAGETEWVGNLHAVLGVVSGDELHLVATGTPVAHLLRENSLNPVIQTEPSAEPPSPLSTFVSIVSGKLKKGDAFVIATPDLSEFVPEELLITALEHDDPGSGAKHLVRHLQKNKVKTVHALISRIGEPDEQPYHTETVYADVPLATPTEILKGIGKTYVIPVLSFVGLGVAKAAAWTLERSQASFGKLREMRKEGTEAKGPDKVPTNAPRGETPPTPVPPSPEMGVVHHIPVVEGGEKAVEKPTRIGPAWPKIPRPNLSFFKRIPRPDLSRVSFSWMKTGWVRWAAVGAAVILLAVVGVRAWQIRSQGGKVVPTAQAQQLLEEARKKKEEGDLAVIYNETERAKTAYAEAISKATEAANNERVREEALDVKSQAQVKLDKLTETTRFTASDPKLTFEGAVGLSAIETTIVTSDSSGQVRVGDMGTSTVKDGGKVTGAIKGFGQWEKDAYVWTDGEIAFVTSDGTVSKLTPPAGGWKDGVDLEVYAGNIYILDSTNNQIWKYVKGSSGYGSATEYFKETATITGSTSMAIDGAIYVLVGNDVQKFSLGKKVDFTLSGIPTPNDKLTAAKKIVTASEFARIYILDGNRIVAVNKTGKFVAQYALPDGISASDFLVSSDEKKLWVLSDNKVYEFGL
jgi:hypothetical protein